MRGEEVESSHVWNCPPVGSRKIRLYIKKKKKKMEDQDPIFKNIFVMENFKCIKKVDPVEQ